MTTASPDPWFPFARPRPSARVRLVCLPYAGGGAGVFRQWANDLPPDIDVLAAQLPGRETRFREPALTRMGPLVVALAAAVRPRLDRPLVLFGASMGALVAFELARALRREGHPAPVALIVAAHAAPHLPRRYGPLHHLPAAEFRARLRTFGGTPAAVLDNDELMQAVLPTLRADFTACETYEPAPEPPLACPVLALGGADDHMAPPPDLEEWRRHTSGPFRARTLPGGHFFIQSYRAEVLTEVATFLNAT